MAEDPRMEARENQQRQLEAALSEMGTVLVRAGRDDGRVALWDTGPEYEGGEVMIKGNAGHPELDYTYELPRTAMVTQKIREGALVEVEDEGEGAGPAPEPAQMSLTPGGPPQDSDSPHSADSEADRLADRREKATKEEESRAAAGQPSGSGSVSPTAGGPKSEAPGGAATSSSSEAPARGAKK